MVWQSMRTSMTSRHYMSLQMAQLWSSKNMQCLHFQFHRETIETFNLSWPPYVCSIIAIPGLATNAIWTFRPKSQAEIWLRDLLPKDISNCRVLLYGYDSKVIGSSDTSAAPQVAQSMGNSITRFRQKTNVGLANCCVKFIWSLTLLDPSSSNHLSWA